MSRGFPWITLGVVMVLLVSVGAVVRLVASSPLTKPPWPSSVSTGRIRPPTRSGLAIFAASKNAGDGFIAFDDFSARSSKYDPRETEARWKHYGRSPPNRTGIGKLARLAYEAGWRPANRLSWPTRSRRPNAASPLRF